MAPHRVAPSAVFDAPSRHGIMRSKLKTISEDHEPISTFVHDYSYCILLKWQLHLKYAPFSPSTWVQKAIWIHSYIK